MLLALLYSYCALSSAQDDDSRPVAPGRKERREQWGEGTGPQVDLIVLSTEEPWEADLHDAEG